MSGAAARPFRRLRPGDAIGILGGGQLGRMLAMAAARLGLKSIILAPDNDPPAAHVAARFIRADYDDEHALKELADTASVITFEFENIPLAALELLETLAPVAPSPMALAITQDRLREKRFLRDLSIAVAPFADVSCTADLSPAIAVIGAPGVLKTRQMGYDGKGQVKIAAREELPAAWSAIARAPAILEGFIAFDYEASIVAARGRDGAFAAYDLIENQHKDHILSESRVPARASDEIAAAARDIARRIGEGLGFAGVYTTEFFIAGDRLIVNEIAPRVHNSGHWTIEGAETSQFEQHVRAIAGWPLGPTVRRGDCLMRNLIGADVEAFDALLAESGAHVHLYGKTEPRAGRKMGHVTRVLPVGSLKTS